MIQIASREELDKTWAKVLVCVTDDLLRTLTFLLNGYRNLGYLLDTTLQLLITLSSLKEGQQLTVKTDGNESSCINSIMNRRFSSSD
jgi:hypothetical protein